MKIENPLRALGLAAPALLLLGSCAGTRTAGDQTTVYATSFNLLGLQIPYDDFEQAHSMVPPGAEINTVLANPRDWSSVVGILTALLGFSSTEVSYSTE